MSSLRPRVLLLEHQAGLRQVFAEALDELGFEVVATEGRGQALVALLAGAAVDLLVVDLVDPAAGGEGLLALVASGDVTAGVPVIVMTDDERAVAPARTLRLVKPFGLEELSLAVQEALRTTGTGGDPKRPDHASQ